MAEMYYRKQWVQALQFWPEKEGKAEPLGGYSPLPYYVQTTDGYVEVRPGDWIVSERDDSIHIVSPDKFAEDYDQPAAPARMKRSG